MKSFEVRIQVPGKSSPIKVQIQAKNQLDAKNIAAAQFPSGKILAVSVGV